MDANVPQTQLEATISALRQDDAARAEAAKYDLPFKWDVGQHRYFRIPSHLAPYPSKYEESDLSNALDRFKERGVTVLGFQRFSYTMGGSRRDDWIVKTMAPRDSSPT